MERRIDLISEWLSKQDDSDLIEMWNQYQRDNCYESEIWPMSELYVFVEGRDIFDVIDEFCNGMFRYQDDYFAWSGLGNVRSFNHIYQDGSPYDEGELADYIDQDDNDMGYAELNEILHQDDRREDEDDDE